jgi:hypothetical protein
MATQNKTKLKLEVTDMDALAKEYPHAIKKVVIVREDHTALYALAKAHLVTGKPIPGVIITKPDGSMLMDAEAAKTMPPLTNDAA